MTSGSSWYLKTAMWLSLASKMAFCTLGLFHGSRQLWVAHQLLHDLSWGHANLLRQREALVMLLLAASGRRQSTVHHARPAAECAELLLFYQDHTCPGPARQHALPQAIRHAASAVAQQLVVRTASSGEPRGHRARLQLRLHGVCVHILQLLEHLGVQVLALPAHTLPSAARNCMAEAWAGQQPGTAGHTEDVETLHAIRGAGQTASMCAHLGHTQLGRLCLPAFRAWSAADP